jgi:hypothetical protein
MGLILMEKKEKNVSVWVRYCFFSTVVRSVIF